MVDSVLGEKGGGTVTTKNTIGLVVRYMLSVRMLEGAGSKNDRMMSMSLGLF